MALSILGFNLASEQTILVIDFNVPGLELFGFDEELADLRVLLSGCLAEFIVLGLNGVGDGQLGCLLR